MVDTKKMVEAAKAAHHRAIRAQRRAEQAVARSRERTAEGREIVERFYSPKPDLAGLHPREMLPVQGHRRLE
jgi:hypothetical protein